MTRMPLLIWHIKQDSRNGAKRLLDEGAKPRLTGTEPEFWYAADAVPGAVHMVNELLLRDLLVYSKQKWIGLKWMGRLGTWSLPGRQGHGLLRESTYLHWLSLWGLLSCVELIVEE